RRRARPDDAAGRSRLPRHRRGVPQRRRARDRDRTPAAPRRHGLPAAVSGLPRIQADPPHDELRPAARVPALPSPALELRRDAGLAPALAVRWGPGFGPLRQAPGVAWRTLAPAARIQVANRRTLRPATVVARLRARVPARVTVTYPTGVQQQVLVTARGTT